MNFKRVGLFFAGLLLMNSAIRADGFPDGQWNGTGKMKADDNEFSYRVQVTIKDDKVTASYSHFEPPAPNSLKMHYENEFATNDFNFFFDGKNTTGKCKEDEEKEETLCEWRFVDTESFAEDELKFRGKSLFRRGSKSFGKKVIVWKEELGQK